MRLRHAHARQARDAHHGAAGPPRPDLRRGGHRGREGKASAAPDGRLIQPRGQDGCIHRNGVNRCTRGRAVTSPEDVVVSPDGRHVYVAAYGSHAVAVFARDRRTGLLGAAPGRRGCMRQGRGRRVRAGARRSAARRRSRSARTAATCTWRRRAATRSASSRATGARASCASSPARAAAFRQRPGDGCAVGRALNEPTSVAVSPDGSRVYVAGRRFPSGVAIFARAPDGSLTQAAEHCGLREPPRRARAALSARGISAPEEVLVTPDSRHVLVAGSRSNAVAVLASGPAGLSQADGAAGCISRGGGRGLRTPARRSPARWTSRSARTVATSTRRPRSPTGSPILRRNRATGALTQSTGRARLHQPGRRRRALRRRARRSTRSGASPSARTAGTSTPSRRR